MEFISSTWIESLCIRNLSQVCLPICAPVTSIVPGRNLSKRNESWNLRFSADERFPVVRRGRTIACKSRMRQPNPTRASHSAVDSTSPIRCSSRRSRLVIALIDPRHAGLPCGAQPFQARMPSPDLSFDGADLRNACGLLDGIAGRFPVPFQMQILGQKVQSSLFQHAAPGESACLPSRIGNGDRRARHCLVGAGKCGKTAPNFGERLDHIGDGYLPGGVRRQQ